MEEKLRILHMVEEGKLSAEQAVELMNALDGYASEEKFDNALEPSATRRPGAYEDKMLRVIVDSPEGDKVNVQLPVRIIRQVLKVTGQLPIKSEDLKNIDLDALTTSILECLDNETLGDIVTVDTSDGSTVRVFIG